MQNRHKSIGQYYTTLGHNFSVLTSAPVNICVLTTVAKRSTSTQIHVT